MVLLTRKDILFAPLIIFEYIARLVYHTYVLAVYTWELKFPAKS